MATYDIIGNLPVEIGQNIFMYLSSEDLCNALKCCRRWRYIASGDYFWRTRIEKEFDFVRDEDLDTKVYDAYVQNFSSRSEGQYMYIRELDYNWRNGIFTSSVISLPGQVEALIYVDEEILIVAVESNKILIVNISNGKIEKSFFAEKWIHVEKNEDLLYAICENRNRTAENSTVIFKVWDLQSCELIFDLQTELLPTYYKTDRSFCKDLIAYISLIQEPDPTSRLHIFHIRKGKLDFWKNDVVVIHCNNDIIAAGTLNGIIEIMDLNYNPLTTLKCCKARCFVKIEMKNDYLVTICVNPGSAESWGVVCIWDLKTESKLHTMKESTVTSLTFVTENIVICEQLFSYTLLNVQTGEYILEVHQDYRPRSDIFISNNFFIFLGNGETAALDMWCLRTQKLINCLNFKTLYPAIYPVGSYEPNFFPVVSKTNMAHFSKTDLYSVHIMDFAPNIANQMFA